MFENYDLSPGIIGELMLLMELQHIVIHNASDQMIKARIDTTRTDDAIGSADEYHIAPGSSEKWTRNGQEVVRICAYSLWHDFKLSPAAAVRFTNDFQLQILEILPDGIQRRAFGWNGTEDGPHIE